MSKEKETINHSVRNITNSGHPKLRENPPEPSIMELIKRENTKPKHSVELEKSKIDRVSVIKKLNSNKYRSKK